MKQQILVALAAVALAGLVVTEADAAKMGGGRSFGAQRSSVVPRTATPPSSTSSGAASQPVMPATPGATLPARPAAPAAAPAAAGASRWLGPIAGLAAGIGLAALLSHFGLPDGMGTFLLLALLAIGVIFVVRMLFARRVRNDRPLAYAAERSASPAFEMPSAPQWGGASRVEPTLGAAQPATRNAFPPGFDAAGFERHAKEQFVRLQAAYDAGDRKTLGDVMTPEMIDEIWRELDSGAPRRPTKVETLNAEVLDVETRGDQHWASVRFTGTLREADSAAVAFDEVWNLTKPADGSSGWLLAGIQQIA